MKRAWNQSKVGASLIITLSMLAIVMILTVAMLSVVRIERTTARNVISVTQARSISDLAANHALSLIREAISAAEGTVTDPVARNRKFWVSQPGKITVFRADGTVDEEASRALYPLGNGVGVNLNEAPFGGVPPIVADDGMGNAPVMNLPWVAVLADPSSSSSASNPLVGRYSFWVDDESTKLNVNTADGSAKGSGGESFGDGTPPEVNLEALRAAAGTILPSDAEAIAQFTGARHEVGRVARPLNSVREIGQVPGLPDGVPGLNHHDLTVYSRSPDISIFGEPRIFLTTAIPGVRGTIMLKERSVPLTLMTGEHAALVAAPHSLTMNDLRDRILAIGRPLDWIYPSSGVSLQNSQLPPFTYRAPGELVDTSLRLPQFFRDDVEPYVSSSVANRGRPFLFHPDHSIDYEMGMRIARYLKGWNSMGNPLMWPKMDGKDDGADELGEKYTDRQLDDLTVQILSTLKAQFVDHYYGHNLPWYLPKGYLSGRPVRGYNRGPRLTEVVMRLETVAGDPPSIKMQIMTEFYLPSGFKGVGLDFGDLTWILRINPHDIPRNNQTKRLGPSYLGGDWMDNLMWFTDQNGEPAGVDMFGNAGHLEDPDQDKARDYHHPWALKDSALPYHPSTNPYMGTGPSAPLSGMEFFSPFRVLTTFPSGTVRRWRTGDYMASRTSYGANAYPMRSGTTSVTVHGGLAIWLQQVQTFDSRPVEAVPLDSLDPFFPKMASPATPAELARFREAVIPIPGTEAERTIPVPGVKVFHFWVADPLVNMFPGDWEGRVYPDLSSPAITMPVQFTSPQFYSDGDNTAFRPSGEGDPESVWWPEQEIAIPKSRRFPSVGFMQYFRTGTMPDPEDEAKPLREQKGTPWRMLNFSPSDAPSQATRGGKAFPDWLLLELFHTPAIFQPLGNPLPAPVIRTWGGATAGRVNPNAVLEPFGIARQRALEAVFKGTSVVTDYDAQGQPEQTLVNPEQLATAVTEYVKALGRPLMFPAEICNIPAVAAMVYEGVDEMQRSRNDLVRKTVGNLTTRSNTFTIWTVAEVIQKKRGNTQYGVFEAGDVVVGRSRRSYLVERYLDPGSDGVYGNTVDPGLDGVVNTPDDPLTEEGGAHPPMTYPLPYKYRIISVSQVE